MKLPTDADLEGVMFGVLLQYFMFSFYGFIYSNTKLLEHYDVMTGVFYVYQMTCQNVDKHAMTGDVNMCIFFSVNRKSAKIHSIALKHTDQ